MSKHNFTTMNRAELRRYILAHREDQEALQAYIDRFQDPEAIVFPAPESVEDLEHYPELHRQYQDRKHQRD
ncbi:DUF6887 family protein [Chlorogloeopsis fritschii PCC 9212]|uniref:Uncharacterized protein n=1 Tax=Chlorogloeopsis fritschii PCC 6912 TaxID=211165 RepID=A0A433N040_CHLFR|nr:hypothetical protein [Chlorogloeopsis fritschii]RUR74221.1 hypothetical protein PCC6912_53220 [Chlorogloeopsis fritschii PCC 6912]